MMTEAHAEVKEGAEQKPVTREVILNRSGVTVTIPDDWTIGDTQAAGRLAKGEAGRMQLALIQRVCLFDGKRWTLSDIESRLGGKDYMQLLGEFYGDDEGQEGEAGND